MRKPQAVADAATGRAAGAKVLRYMMTYIVLGQFFVQIDRTNIGFAQLAMGHDLGLSATAFGFASGVFALAALFVQIPASILFDRLGARRFLTGLMICWGVAVMTHALVTSPVQLYLLRFALGGLEAGFVPGALVLVNRWFSGHRHGTLTAALPLGAALAGIIGGPFAGWVLGHSLLGLTGWRSLFLLEGGSTVIWALVALRIVYDSPLRATWLNDDERGHLARELDAYQLRKNEEGAVEKAGIGDVLKDPRILVLILASSFAGWVSATFAFFLPTLLRIAGKGMDYQAVGLLSIFPFFVTGAVALGWGAHADRTERHWHCVLPLLVGATGLLIYPVARSPISAMLCLAMVQAGNAGFFVNFWPTCSLIVGKDTVARTTGLINMGSHVGSFVAPVVFGWLLDNTGTPTAGLYVCLAVLLFNFTVMNMFFFAHKARLKGQTTNEPADACAGATTN